MHVQKPATSRKDPQAFVLTLCLVIIALTCIAVITTQVGVPLI